ncbi:hypothetical protein F4814DRAFT_341595 [Daldinia grandis]|nr:hypothetical protein F4814DRAFT_341595 [Daldinia grandis]
MPNLPINRVTPRDLIANLNDCWIKVPSINGNVSVHIDNGGACKQYEIVNHNFCNLDPSFQSLFQHVCPPTTDATPSIWHKPVPPSAEEYGTLALIFAGGFLSIILFAIVVYRCNKGTRYVHEPGYN